MTTLFILCGLPFSGKSTLARDLSKKTNGIIISLDKVWAELTDRKRAMVEWGEVVEEVDRLISKNLAEGNDVIYDDMNPLESHRNRVVHIANEKGAQYKIVYIDVSKKDMEDRQKHALAEDIHRIVTGEDIAKAMDQFEKPKHAVVLKSDEDIKKFISSL